MRTTTKTITALAIAAGLALATVAGPANAIVRTSFPAYSTVASPKGTPPAPYYSSGKRTVINLPSCTSGKANQQTFYSWIRFSGATQPNWSQPIRIEVCI